MLNSARVIAFVPASDLDRAKTFYTKILGLSEAGSVCAGVGCRRHHGEDRQGR
jgi:catechol 2,3-dioxygenase-like lactoylglutathione lyase family enzyme